ncbi:putative membrane protein SpoIIM required for sporulation [Aquimarina sp. EL_43]|uniref:stage II sporulation protein M n=1 Tax=Aquimarina TaxID=290174 RepID=UPI0004AF8AB0|nr:MULTISPECIES: stage II sporulation protein M [Aquimarina]MBG6129104.1 putative membrane protein SpoIIM required for sporulation [Aquimarina sp. EL_35]MBG6150169.1 putative membrane protein SpoIIM required for sporulation [Aquimarina sp. EL_32]MBG6167146.1 putative membrane protein SpoIIM required for sporulation [Aquimarina sp. EL_43]
MREAAFVRQNKDKWLKFESVLVNNAQITPDELSNLYIEITDHLSYAQTFYPNSQTLNYLNGLASSAHQKIYKTKKEKKNRLYSFWVKEFPLEFYQYQKHLLIAFLISVLFTAIGAYSSATDGAFVRSILGDAYVNMTLENIANEDPMAVYKQMGETNMFLGITLNNIKVALNCFILGVLFGIGTIYMLMQNFIMLGSFQYFFYEKGLLWESARTIWIHGTIEISVIIIAGCAGLVVGNSILFPKTYTRLTSFVKGIKAGLKIVISTVPFFILAGFLEGFVTRHTEMPDWLAILIISGSLALILFYYVIYPRQLYNRLKNE